MWPPDQKEHPVKSIEEWLTQPGQIAGRLRALRARAALSGKQLAEANGWAQSKVSRIESGRQMPSPADVHAWAAACGADEDETSSLLAAQKDARIAHAMFRDRMRSGQASVQESYNNLVQRSTEIRHLETVYVPGLLQVPGYAKRVLEEMIDLHGLEIDDVDAAVAARMERQRFVYDASKRFEFLLFEPVLRTNLAGPDVMRAQLDRLQTVIGLANVRFGVIPMGPVLQRTPQAAVQVYTSDDTVAVAEDLAGEHWHRDPETVAAYLRGIERLWEDAVEGDEARRLLSAASASL